MFIIYIFIGIIWILWLFDHSEQEPYYCPKCNKYQLNVCYDNCSKCGEKLYWTNRTSREIYLLNTVYKDLFKVRKL